MALELGGTSAAAAYVGAALASAAYVGGDLAWPEPTGEFDTETVADGDWYDPATWSAGLPDFSAGDVARVQHLVTVDGAAVDFGIVCDAGEIEMRPGAQLRFENVDESQFVGGGLDPLATDIGLWVMGSCKLDIQGTSKTSWTRLTGGATAGATSIDVQDATGWQVGDQIVIVPTEPPSVGSRAWNGFETRFIASISGTTVSVSTGLSHDHPSVTDPFTGIVHTAEVLNLTRDVRIEGTGTNSAAGTSGRAHILIRNDVPVAHEIRHVELVLLGTREGAAGSSDGVTGRYPLHFHMGGDNSRGSLVEGVVVRQSGNRAFVPHASHGVTFLDTVAYDIWEDAYWWDPGQTTNATDDVVWDRTVAALVRNDPDYRGYRLTGYALQSGENPVLRNSVAVGIQGNSDASGFQWPEGSSGVWVFDQGNVAHNNKKQGLFAWQNDQREHVIDDFVAYHNSDNGIEHGAYRNAYKYLNSSLIGNGDAAVVLHAQSNIGGEPRPDGYTLVFEGVQGTGALELPNHTLFNSAGPVLFKDCSFSHIEIDENSEPGVEDFVNCEDADDGTELEPADFTIINAPSDMQIRIQYDDCTAELLDGTGTVTAIGPFYPPCGGG